MYTADMAIEMERRLGLMTRERNAARADADRLRAGIAALCDDPDYLINPFGTVPVVTVAKLRALLARVPATEDGDDV